MQTPQPRIPQMIGAAGGGTRPTVAANNSTPAPEGRDKAKHRQVGRIERHGASGEADEVKSKRHAGANSDR